MGRRGWEGSGGRSWEGGREGEVRRRMEKEGREGVREKKKCHVVVIYSILKNFHQIWLQF